MIKRLRYALSWPLIVLQFAVAFLFSGLGYMARGIMWVQRGGLPHVYWPIMLAKRVVRGELLWQVQDCVKLGIQPKTDEDRARADADERLIRLECTCGQDDCGLRGGVYLGRDSAPL